jgi:hypothetical protein
MMKCSSKCRANLTGSPARRSWTWLLMTLWTKWPWGKIPLVVQ